MGDIFPDGRGGKRMALMQERLRDTNKIGAVDYAGSRISMYFAEFRAPPTNW